MASKSSLGGCPFCDELRNLKEIEAQYRSKRGDNTTPIKYRVCIVKETYGHPDDPDYCTGLLTGSHHEFRFCPLCGKGLVTDKPSNVCGEVVCSSRYLDVGLLVKVDSNGNPEKILARYEQFSGSGCYGGIKQVKWKHTGKYLTVEEWNRLTKNKSTDEVLLALNITKVL